MVMIKRLISAVLFTSLLFFWGCTIQGPEYTEELDIVVTHYDVKFDFKAPGTYSMPDKVVKITGDPLAPPEYIKDIYGVPILAKIDQNMTDLGWTKVDVNSDPDVQLLPAAWSTTTIVGGGYWGGGYYCWWYPYYCGGGGWYYPYYPVSSYSTGTMLISIIDAKHEGTDGGLPLVWTAAMNGLLSGTYEIDRVNQGIDQAFKQSPYLKTN
jgi:hypothetical protein